MLSAAAPARLGGSGGLPIISPPQMAAVELAVGTIGGKVLLGEESGMLAEPPSETSFLEELSSSSALDWPLFGPLIYS